MIQAYPSMTLPNFTRSPILETLHLKNLSWLTWRNMNEEVALDVAVEVCVTWEISVKYKLLDAMILPTHVTT
jgi:hypothetical protein